VLHRAAELSLKVNFEVLDKPVHKAVVYLDAESFIQWIGSKGIYRTGCAGRRAELIVLAPRKGIREDKAIDAMIRNTAIAALPRSLQRSKPTPIWPRVRRRAHLIHASLKAASPSPGAPATSPGKRLKA